MAKVEVRVALAIDPSGDWYAVGWKRGKHARVDVHERDMLDAAGDGLDKVGETLRWIDAEVDVPEIEAVVGTVSNSVQTKGCSDE